MTYPKFLRTGAKVGVTALSQGVVDQAGKNCFSYAKEKLAKGYGFTTTFTEDVFTDFHGRSAPAEERARQFDELVRSGADWIVAAAGGDHLNEVLGLIDYGLFSERHPWVQGYSDNTSLLYAITTRCDLATVYGHNFSAFGRKPYERCQRQYLDLLSGKVDEVRSLSRYEDRFHESEDGTEPFFPDQRVFWVNGRGEESLSMKGRLLGGCTEVLFALVGTPYERTLEFCERYHRDGILFFFETFSSDEATLSLHLWQLREAGWLRHASGLLFGRPMFFRSHRSYRDAVMEVVQPWGIPAIFEADVGHKGPTIPMVNGALATVESSGGKGKVTYEFS